MRWLFLLACACGRIDFDAPPGAVVTDGAAPDHPADAACAWSAWSAPQRIAVLSSSDNDWEPALSPDGTQLVYVQSNATSATLLSSLWTGTAWAAPTAIAALDTVSFDYGPAWNAAGTRLYFVSDQAGNIRMYSSTFSGGTFGTPALVPGLAGIEAVGPTLSVDELEMFYTVNPSTTSGLAHVARATRATTADAWTDLGAVPELSVSVETGWPSLAPDGLTVYVEDDSGTPTIYSATRSAVGAPFSTPVPVAELNTAGGNGDPDFSRDGKTMVFSSSRPPSAGYDVFVSTRTCN